LGPPTQAACDVIPSVPLDVFRAHLQTLGDVVDLVTVDELFARESARTSAPTAWRRPAVAVTLDDDLPSHGEYAVPLLREFGVPATFFLSGRALHGLGAYWFQQLEALLVGYGEPRTLGLLGLRDRRCEDLVRTCEANATLRERIARIAVDLPPPEVLSADAIKSLAAAGMTIGFHTLHHEVVPNLDDTALEAALSHGRGRLATAAGAPVRYFAYPCGKSDARSAEAVRDAGFEAAFTGQPQPLRPRDDRYRIGRWEPGPLDVEELLVKLAMRLHRAAPPVKDLR
jgi:peptidoglycan/xylan/chitin deacetylase (PgdA/CDA1 family)